MINRCLLSLLLALSLPLQARPAAWYWWTSKLDGQRVCLQTAPAQGWTRAGGPFRDAHCTQPDRRA